jgi:GTP cyclohydrolase IA
MNDNFDIETFPISDEIKKNYEDIIHLLGEDKLREGLLKTPERAAKAMKFLTEGYEQDPKQILQSAMFEETYNEMISNCIPYVNIICCRFLERLILLIYPTGIS